LRAERFQTMVYSDCRGCDSSLACTASLEKGGGEATHVGHADESADRLAIE
jgi:hypothetical protein